jgi:hypothetical protein
MLRPQTRCIREGEFGPQPADRTRLESPCPSEVLRKETSSLSQPHASVECTPASGQGQAADLTICRACSFSKLAGIALHAQDIIPPQSAPDFHIPVYGRAGCNGLTAYINNLPASDKDVTPVQYVPDEEMNKDDGDTEPVQPFRVGICYLRYLFDHQHPKKYCPKLLMSDPRHR